VGVLPRKEVSDSAKGRVAEILPRVVLTMIHCGHSTAAGEGLKADGQDRHHTGHQGKQGSMYGIEREATQGWDTGEAHVCQHEKPCHGIRCTN